jgi:hypothetical protein
MNLLPLVSLTCIARLAFAAPKKTNVVFILIDDFGSGCATANGVESYRTRGMDRIAPPGSGSTKCTPNRFGHLEPKQRTFVRFF